MKKRLKCVFRLHTFIERVINSMHNSADRIQSKCGFRICNNYNLINQMWNFCSIVTSIQVAIVRDYKLFKTIEGCIC